MASPSSTDGVKSGDGSLSNGNGLHPTAEGQVSVEDVSNHPHLRSQGSVSGGLSSPPFFAQQDQLLAAAKPAKPTVAQLAAKVDTVCDTLAQLGAILRSQCLVQSNLMVKVVDMAKKQALMEDLLVKGIEQSSQVLQNDLSDLMESHFSPLSAFLHGKIMQLESQMALLQATVVKMPDSTSTQVVALLGKKSFVTCTDAVVSHSASMPTNAVVSNSALVDKSVAVVSYSAQKSPLAVVSHSAVAPKAVVSYSALGKEASQAHGLSETRPVTPPFPAGKVNDSVNLSLIAGLEEMTLNEKLQYFLMVGDQAKVNQVLSEMQSPSVSECAPALGATLKPVLGDMRRKQISEDLVMDHRELNRCCLAMIKERLGMLLRKCMSCGEVPPREQRNCLRYACKDFADFILDELNTDVPCWTVEQGIARLLEKFGSATAASSARLTFYAAKQESGDDVTMFAQKLIHIARLAFPELTRQQTDPMITSKFMDGLAQERVRQHVQRANCMTFSQAIEAARTEEAISSQFQKRSKDGRIFGSNTVDAGQTSKKNQFRFDGSKAGFKGQNKFPGNTSANTSVTGHPGVDALCLWDTGSSFTLVSQDFYKSLLLEPSYDGGRSLVAYKGCVPFSASGNNLKVKGCVSMELTFKAKPIKLDVLVVSGLAEPFIFGKNSIDKVGSWTYSPKAGVLKVGCSDVTLPLIKSMPANEVCLCTVNKSTIVHPLQVCKVSLKIWCTKGQMDPRDSWMIEPNASGTLVVSNLRTTCSVVPARSVVWIYVANHSDLPIQLETGMIFGSASPLCETEESDLGVCSVEPSTSQGICSSVSKEDRVKFLDENLKLDATCLSDDGVRRLKDILYQYADVFAVHDTDLGCTPLMQQEIDTGNAKPISRKPYHAGWQKRAIIEKEVSKLLNAGLIFPSVGPWSSPICLVRKKTDEWRMCVDYSKINEVITTDSYPLPRTLDLLQSLSGHSYFSSLDLASGYHQVPIQEQDKIKTQFTCFLGTFSYHRMPFGLKVSPSQFSRLINMAFRGMIYDKVVAYIDDLLVVGKTEDQHIENVKEVMQHLRDADLKLKLSKCSFAQAETQFLGHIVSGDGIATIPSKVEKIKNYPQPKNRKELRRFLGLANYYSMFINFYAEKVACLNDLTSKNVPFHWTDKHTANFEFIKQALCAAPLLAHADPNREFRLYTDASENALGSVLWQLDEDTLYEKPICYYSRKFQPAERRYSNTERELLAVYDSFRHFRPYLWGNKCLVFTDNNAVKYLMHTENPSQRMAKFQFELMGQIDFKVQYVPGKKNVVADCLSRIPDFSDTAVVDEDEIYEVPDDNVVAVVTRSMARQVHGTNGESSDNEPEKLDTEVSPLFDILNGDDVPDLEDLNDAGVEVEPNLFKRVKLGQISDPFLSKMITFKQAGILPKDKKIASKITVHADKYLIDNQGILRQQDGFADPEVATWLVVVPEGPLRQEIIAHFHDDPLSGAHQGISSTYDRIRQRFWWSAIHKSVGDYIKACDPCMRNKSYPHPQRTALNPIETRAKFERVGTDITGPFPESGDGYKYILGFVDLFTKFAVTEPIRDMKASTIAEVFVRRIVSVFGPPSTLLSDRGADFLSSIVSDVCKIFRTVQLRTAAYCPNTNGACERFWRSLKQMLTNYCTLDRDNWDEMLPLVTYAYNTGLRTSTGYTPFELVFGEPPKDHLDNLFFPSKAEFESSSTNVQRLVKHLKFIREAAKHTKDVQQKRMKVTFDKKVRTVKLVAGQLVLRRVNRVSQGIKKKSLTPFWDGPHRVVYAPPGTPTVVIRLFDDPDGVYDRVPIHHLKPYVQSSILPVNFIGSIIKAPSSVPGGYNSNEKKVSLNDVELRAKRVAEANRLWSAWIAQASAHGWLPQPMASQQTIDQMREMLSANSARISTFNKLLEEVEVGHMAVTQAESQLVMVDKQLIQASKDHPPNNGASYVGEIGKPEWVLISMTDPAVLLMRTHLSTECQVRAVLLAHQQVMETVQTVLNQVANERKAHEASSEDLLNADKEDWTSIWNEVGTSQKVDSPRIPDLGSRPNVLDRSSVSVSGSSSSEVPQNKPVEERRCFRCKQQGHYRRGRGGRGGHGGAPGAMSDATLDRLARSTIMRAFSGSMK